MKYTKDPNICTIFFANKRGVQNFNIAPDFKEIFLYYIYGTSDIVRINSYDTRIMNAIIKYETF